MPGLVPEATGQPGGTGMADPFGMMNSLMDFQLKANQNRQFQAQFMANQAIGETLAHAPSLEEGLNQVQQNPLAMGFGGQAVQTARGIQLLQYQGAEVKQKLAASGYDTAVQAGVQAMQDPLNYNKYYDNAMKLVDPLVADKVKPQIDAIRQMIGEKVKGLNLDDPQQAQQAKNAIATAVGGAYALSGGDNAHLASLVGGYTVLPNGMLAKLPGTLQGVGVQPGPVSVGGQQPAGGPPPAPTPGPPNPASDPKNPTPLVVNPSVAAGLVKGADGRPVIGMDGQVHFSNPGEQLAEDHYQTSYAGEERQQNQAARNTKSLTAQMNAAVDDLVKTNQFYEPGVGGDLRGQIGKLKQLFFDATGQEAKGLDKLLPNVNADVQIIDKLNAQLTFWAAQQTEGSGKKALGIVEAASHAVPGMSNTPLGIKLLSGSLDAFADDRIANYSFKGAWKQNPASYGTLTGAEQEYNRQVTPQDIVSRELKKYGMHLTKDGDMSFNDDDELKKAYKSGLIGKVNSPERQANFDHFYEILHPTSPPKQ